MPKWFKQKDDHSCGVIAVMNICRWAGMKIKGEKVTYKKHFKSIKKLLDCDKDGTDVRDAIHHILRIPILSMMRFPRPPIGVIDEMLKDGIVLLSMAYLEVPREAHHVCVILKKKKNHYCVLNLHGKRKKWVSRKTMSEHMLFKIYGEPTAYHIVQKYDHRRSMLMIGDDNG